MACRAIRAARRRPPISVGSGRHVTVVPIVHEGREVGAAHEHRDRVTLQMRVPCARNADHRHLAVRRRLALRRLDARTQVLLHLHCIAVGETKARLSRRGRCDPWFCFNGHRRGPQ